MLSWIYWPVAVPKNVYSQDVFVSLMVSDVLTCVDCEDQEPSSDSEEYSDEDVEGLENYFD